jgi:hypothetical protein
VFESPRADHNLHVPKKIDGYSGKSSKSEYHFGTTCFQNKGSGVRIPSGPRRDRWRFGLACGASNAIHLGNTNTKVRYSRSEEIFISRGAARIHDPKPFPSIHLSTGWTGGRFIILLMIRYGSTDLHFLQSVIQCQDPMQKSTAFPLDQFRPAEKLLGAPLEVLSSTEAMATRLLQESLEEAFNIQQALLPTGPLHLPFVGICYKFRPASVVSGDFLDYFPIGHDKLVALYLGDIVGKGIAAALYGALAVGTLRAIKKEGESPAAVIEFLNRRLGDRHVTQRFCAVQYAAFDGASRELRFVNAGLSPRPIHITEAGCHELGDGGFPCGIFSDVRYDIYTAQLCAGDTVLFSTDGLIEAEDHAGEQFGIERLFTVCEKSRHESAEILLDRVFQAVDAFTATSIQRDDMTAAALRLA